MSKFIELLGEDVSTIRAAIGASAASEKRDGQQAESVVYRLIDPKVMAELYQFYVYSESEVSTINDIKDGYSLRSGVSFSYAERDLDADKFPIHDSLVSVMTEARKWHDMFGFFAVYNPDSLLDRRLSDMLEEDSVLNRDSTGVFETSQKLVVEASHLLDRVVPDDAERLKATLLGEPGAGGRDDDAARDPATAVGRRPRATAVTERLPRTSTLRAPSERLHIDGGRGAPGRPPTSAGTGELRTEFADRGGSDATATMREPSAGQKRVLEIGSSAAETQELKRSRQREGGSRTLDQTIIDLRNLRPVSLHDGNFYVEIDRLNRRRRVVFARKSHVHGAASSSANRNLQRQVVLYGDDGRNRSTETIEIDESVFVYVWDGLMPEDDGRLKTKLHETIRLRRAMDQADRNAAEVDYRRSHPTTLLEQETAAKLSDPDRMTDPQIYGGAGAGGSNPDLEQRAARDAEARLIMSVRADLQNGRIQSDLAKAIADREVDDTLRDGDGNAVPLSLSKNANYFLLPPLVRASSVRVQPDTTSDVNLARYRFRQSLANALSVPLSLVDAGAGFSGRASRGGQGGATSAGAATQASNVVSDKRLRLMVLADRAMLGQFVNSLWDVMYRDIDNETLAELLARSVTRTRRQSEERLEFMRVIERRLAVVTELAERSQLQAQMVDQVNAIAGFNSRLRAIDRAVRETLSMSHRFQVHFENLSYVELGELDKMKADGAISALEHVNAQRSAHGLAPLTQAQYEKNLREQRELELEKMEEEAKLHAKYAPKPAAPAAGNNDGSAKDKRVSGGNDKAKDKSSDKAEKK